MNSTELVKKLITDNDSLCELIIKESNRRGLTQDSIVEWITNILSYPDKNPYELIPSKITKKIKTTYIERVKIRYKWSISRYLVFARKVEKESKEILKNYRDSKIRNTRQWDYGTKYKYKLWHGKYMKRVASRKRGVIYYLTGVNWAGYDFNLPLVNIRPDL